MPRHYSKVLIELPDGPDDPQEVVVTIDCDVCGEMEFRSHIAHFGTLARALSDTYAVMATDGCMEKLTDFESSGNKAKVLEYLNKRFPEWKVGRLKAHAGKH